MSFTPEEATQIKTDVEVLKVTTNQVLTAIGENTEQIKENVKLTTSLIQKMDAHDVRREYEEKERKADREHIDQLKDAVSMVNNRIDAYIDDVKPTISRSKQRHDSVDNFKKSMGTTWGKMFATVLVTAMMLFVAAAFGLDITKLVD